MKLSVELTTQQEQLLAEAAQRLNLRPEELASAAVRDLVGLPDPDFARVAERVLAKNAELYQRLR
jgi:hypothetical protein